MRNFLIVQKVCEKAIEAEGPKICLWAEWFLLALDWLKENHDHFFEEEIAVEDLTVTGVLESLYMIVKSGYVVSKSLSVLDVRRLDFECYCDSFQFYQLINHISEDSVDLPFNDFDFEELIVEDDRADVDLKSGQSLGLDSCLDTYLSMCAPDVSCDFGSLLDGCLFLLYKIGFLSKEYEVCVPRDRTYDTVSFLEVIGLCEPDLSNVEFISRLFDKLGIEIKMKDHSRFVLPRESRYDVEGKKMLQLLAILEGIFGRNVTDSEFDIILKTRVFWIGLLGGHLSNVFWFEEMGKVCKPLRICTGDFNRGSSISSILMRHSGKYECLDSMDKLGYGMKYRGFFKKYPMFSCSRVVYQVEFGGFVRSDFDMMIAQAVLKLSRINLSGSDQYLKVWGIIGSGEFLMVNGSGTFFAIFFLSWIRSQIKIYKEKGELFPGSEFLVSEVLADLLESDLILLSYTNYDFIVSFPIPVLEFLPLDDLFLSNSFRNFCVSRGLCFKESKVKNLVGNVSYSIDLIDRLDFKYFKEEVYKDSVRFDHCYLKEIDLFLSLEGTDKFSVKSVGTHLWMDGKFSKNQIDVMLARSRKFETFLAIILESLFFIGFNLEVYSYLKFTYESALRIYYSLRGKVPDVLMLLGKDPVGMDLLTEEFFKGFDGLFPSWESLVSRSFVCFYDMIEYIWTDV